MKLNAGNIPATIAVIEAKWKASFPELPFQYTFLDQDFNSQYAADQKRGKIFTAFSISTILITCLGLLGLIAFTTQQRQKEISIRKVMGANTGQLIPLMTKNFVLLVGLSCLIAFPVAWYFMDKWLQDYVYRIKISWWIFLVGGISAVVIALITVSFQAIKAALANPVKSLRTE